jgi:hypothetical protein
MLMGAVAPVDVVLREYVRQLLPLEVDRAVSATLVLSGSAGAASSSAAALVPARTAPAKSAQSEAPLAYRDRIAGVLDDVEDKAALVRMLHEECIPRLSATDYDGRWNRWTDALARRPVSDG